MRIRIFKSNNSMFLIESLNSATEDITNQLNMKTLNNENFELLLVLDALGFLVDFSVKKAAIKSTKW